MAGESDATGASTSTAETGSHADATTARGSPSGRAPKPTDCRRSDPQTEVMTSRVSHTSVDCTNAYRLSEWWKQVLDYVDVADDPNEPGHAECMILSRDGSHRLLFIEVPEAKARKNRMHLDLQPIKGLRDDELTRLLESGAIEIADRRGIHGPGTGWVVLADPEGNEFCILRSAAERSA